ncbi:MULTISPECIES: RagB/SusD family nutrient uptake outer membrane protein [Niastella]|uniref:RagB/SusD family nutrient uptake outer membrane protein n=1 Tax=Niastella soli TaxID=2821487 RepID=A0ABS3YY43_9BACT|nr:RagB/SusD family nutrient uptake outer membrane protein [Niastella soli]MBO9202852.1 RagB/SusD family nutrient uptake outer membrane protein [Niastella soli]
MKKINLSIAILSVSILLTCCNKLDLYPETILRDEQFWNTESDLMNACNRLYELLPGNWIDNRGDDNVNQNANTTSNGAWTIPNTSGEWNDRYKEIFTANNILEKGGKAKVNDAIRNRYFAEARFFRAYAYFQLVMKYGDVPLVLHTMDVNSPDLTMGRTPRAEVLKAIYDDLDFAASWLPLRASLPGDQWGRLIRSAAWGLKARVGLYEGTREKFIGASGWQAHLQTAIDNASLVMAPAQGHALFPDYGKLFVHDGEGATNKENIFVKIYGVDSANAILAHNNSRDLENGRIAITRNLIRQYLYTDGLPAFNTDGTPVATPSPLFVPEANELAYNTVFDNRDPRLTYTVFKKGETAYKGAWAPTTSLGSRSGYATKKGFNNSDWVNNTNATTDRILMRYAEILLIYAEAKFELSESISDADLNLTVNALRTRAGMAAKLTNAFVTASNLSMRDEIRRERTVELALEGFHYDDLIRWHTAETVLPKDLLGAKFIQADWLSGTNASSLKLNADKVVIAEAASTRKFQANRDYLYPVPLNEISTSGNNVTQNPNWQ